jgi:nucleoside-diphosphate-sugar epimerase
VKGAILITGADGYLGSRVARRLAETTDVPLILWSRARDGAMAAAKREDLERALGGPSPRFAFVPGDLEDPEPFVGVDAKAVAGIVHAAAVIRFNVEAALADRVNVRGAEKLLAFAERCPALSSLCLLSSVYASGLRAGAIGEDHFTEADGFANHYERSKRECENLLPAHRDLPWKICRLATAIADNELGQVTQYNAFHNTLKLFFHGLMSIVPGKPETPLYFVTGDFAAAAAVCVLRQGAPRGIYHASHARGESLTLGRLVDAAFAEFGRDAGFRARRILPPLFSDFEAFALLDEGVRNFAGGIVRQSVASVAPFARQLYIDKDIRNDKLAALMGSAYRAPDPETLLRNACARLVATRWGREAAHD